VTKSIAATVPTSVEELSALGVLGQKKVSDYGERLVKHIKKFIEDEGLEAVLEARRPAKQTKLSNTRPKNSSSKKTPASKRKAASSSSKTVSKPRKAKKGKSTAQAIDLLDDDDDEFAADIDFSAIELPSSSRKPSNPGKSPYFNDSNG